MAPHDYAIVVWKQKRKKEVAPLSHLFLPRTDAEWFSRNDPYAARGSSPQ